MAQFSRYVLKSGLNLPFVHLFIHSFIHSFIQYYIADKATCRSCTQSLAE